MSNPQNILFVCSRNQWRSPTAERIWRDAADVNVRSAGTSPSAKRRLGIRDIEWADVILVMEPKHRDVIRANFGQTARHADIRVLDIPDEYGFMDEELVEMLRERVGRVLGDCFDDHASRH